MSEVDPPRRALLVGPADGESTTLLRSSGWPTEAAAFQATGLLDTDAASRQVEHFVGFLQLGVESWAVLRGGLAPAPRGSALLRWREVVVFGPGDLARVRFDPLRLLPATPPELDRTPDEPLDPAAVSDASASDDAARARTLRALGSGAGREALTQLLAAVLDVPHTLVTGSPWTADDIELLMLLLPPRLRAAVTFHTYATSLPREPIPRLVLTQLDEDWPFERATPVWGHRLPATTSAIRPRALKSARALTELLDSPARLAEAHQAYGRYADVLRSGSFDLLQEVERVVHYDAVAQARDGRDAKTSLRLLLGASPAGSDVLFASIRSAFPAGALTAALAELLIEEEPGVMAPVARRFVASPGGATEVIRALAVARGGNGGPTSRRVSAAVDCARAAYRRLPLDQWPTGLELAEALLDLCRLAEGGWDREFRAPAEDRSDVALAAQPDLDVFLGFLGVDAARSRPARWELSDRGPELVAEVLTRVQRAATDEPPVEAVHWSLALIERIRLGQVDHEFLSLAAALLRETKVRGTAAQLRAYLDARAAAASWLLEDGTLRELLGSREIAGHWAAAVERALLEAAETRDMTPVEAACQHLARAGVQLHEPHLLQHLAQPIRTLVTSLTESAGRRQSAARITALHALLAAITAPEAGPALRRLLLDEPETPITPPAPPPEPQPSPIGFQPTPEKHSTAPAKPERVEEDQPPLLVVHPERKRSRRRSLLAAATVAVVLGGALVANVVFRGNSDEADAGGVSNTADAVGTVPAATPAPAPERRAASIPVSRDLIAAELAEARLHARSQDWGRVVEVLSTAAPDAAFPEAFAYDSLLAASALRQALALANQDSARDRLLELARVSSSRALQTIESFGPGADELRLLRAEACIAGQLACDPQRITQDLILAARSGSTRVSARAAELLARWAADQDTL